MFLDLRRLLHSKLLLGLKVFPCVRRLSNDAGTFRDSSLRSFIHHESEVVPLDAIKFDGPTIIKQCGIIVW